MALHTFFWIGQALHRWRRRQAWWFAPGQELTSGAKAFLPTSVTIAPPMFRSSSCVSVLRLSTFTTVSIKPQRPNRYAHDRWIWALPARGGRGAKPNSNSQSRGVFVYTSYFHLSENPKWDSRLNRGPVFHSHLTVDNGTGCSAMHTWQAT